MAGAQRFNLTKEFIERFRPQLSKTLLYWIFFFLSRGPCQSAFRFIGVFNEIDAKMTRSGHKCITCDKNEKRITVARNRIFLDPSLGKNKQGVLAHAQKGRKSWLTTPDFEAKIHAFKRLRWPHRQLVWWGTFHGNMEKEHFFRHQLVWWSRVCSFFLFCCDDCDLVPPAGRAGLTPTDAIKSWKLLTNDLQTRKPDSQTWRVWSARGMPQSWHLSRCWARLCHGYTRTCHRHRLETKCESVTPIWNLFICYLHIIQKLFGLNHMWLCTCQSCEAKWSYTFVHQSKFSTDYKW